MKILQKLYQWYGKKTVIAVLALVLVLVFVAMGRGDATSDFVTEEPPQERFVTLAPVTGLIQESFSIIGVVESINEARIETETAGRVTTVRVNLGDEVRAGQVIATLENASEQAAVLQAEGAYEAALANAAKDDVSVEEAENNVSAAKDDVRNTIRAAFTTVQSAVFNTFDTYYSDPTNSTPGVRLTNTPYTAELSAARVALQKSLPLWQERVDALSKEVDHYKELDAADKEVSNAIAITDTFIAAANYPDLLGKTDAEITVLSNTFTTLKSTLLGSRSALESARSALKDAEDALTRITLGGTSSSISSANAAIKQALGRLRSAEADLNKTIITTPINGTVNALPVRTGTYVGSFAPVATIANNNALEIRSFINESEAQKIQVGDEVLISNVEVGVVARMAQAVDPATGKIEIIVSSESSKLQNGDSVTLRVVPSENTEQLNTGELRIPLTAVRLTANDAFVFTVEKGMLSAHPVTLGRPNGTHITITEGIDPNWEIVTDARGLADGMRVTVRQ